MPKSKAPKKHRPFIFKSWMIGQLRRICRRYPPYYTVLNRVKDTYYVESKKGKPMKRVQYTCSSCSKKCKTGEVSVDHITPVVDPATGFPLLADGTPNWNEFINRLFCGEENLQVLCDDCHDIKSGTENKARKRKKKELTNQS